MHIVIYVYEDFTPLEVFGPHDLFSRFPDTKITLVGEERGVVYSREKSISLNIKYDINDIDKADILLIPGSTIGWTQQIKNKAVLAWIRQIDETTRYTTAACTGTLILAASGQLKDKKATTFWRVADLLQYYDTQYIDEPIVQDGKYYTAEAVSSSMDLAMLIGGLIRGEHSVKITQLLLGYESNNLTDLKELKANEELVSIANKKLEKQAKKTLTLLRKIINIRLLMQLNRK